MTRELIPQPEPDLEGAPPPMVYIREELTWRYQIISRDLKEEQILGEKELNELGARGWELVTSVTAGSVVHFYLCKPQGL